MADKVNQIKQSLIDEKAKLLAHKSTLAGLSNQESAAKSAVNSILERVASGASSDADTKALADSQAALAAFGPRLAAQRQLVANTEQSILDIEKDLHAEEKRLGDEAAALAANPSGRVSVSITDDQRDKMKRDTKRGFADHKDFLTAVMRFGVTGGQAFDERLRPLAAVKQVGGFGGSTSTPFATVGSDEQGVYSNPHGGFLVPVGVAPGILSVSSEDDPLAGLLTNVPMTAPTVKFNARVDKDHSTSVSGGFTVSRHPETIDLNSSRMQFEQVVLTANDEVGLAFATEQILTDSPISFVAQIQAGFRDEYVAFAMNERINGSGSGERLGLLNSPAKIDVTKEVGQAGSTIVKENIDKMEARCWKYSRAVWLANHNTRPQLKSLVQVVGTGGNAVPYFSGTNGGQETLSGRPIYFSEFAKTLGTSGDLILLVPSEYLEGTYQSEQYAESIHVRFTALERAFRFYRRNDGRPWWSSPLTPKNGATLSPIVTLATRA